MQIRNQLLLMTAATIALAELTARRGDRAGALGIVRGLGTQGEGVRSGTIEVALLHSLGRDAEARDRLAGLMRLDPANSLLRYEATRLGADDAQLWPHLAADHERILDVATEYLRLGLCGEVVALLAHPWPAGPDVVTEPGMPRPETYPLIAYYRGFCRDAAAEDGAADIAAAARMPTRYVFPNRPESFTVLRRALAADSGDATAHLLLGSLLMASGLPDSAMQEWEAAARLNPRLPALYGMMARTVLATGGSPDRAVELFAEGTRVDSLNVGLYLGLEQAMRRAGRSADDRVRALLGYPDWPDAPSTLVYAAVGVLAEAGRFDEAEHRLAGRYLSREEGGTNVRQVYLDLRLQRARALASRGECTAAARVLDHLADAVPALPFTHDGLRPLARAVAFQRRVAEARASCRR